MANSSITRQQFPIAALSLFVALFLCQRAVVLANDVLAQWIGTYRYEWAGGRTVGGSPIMLDFQLDIGMSRTEAPAKLTIKGFQTEEALLCDVDAAGPGISLLFRSYATGATHNQYGVEVYKPGERILRLEKSTGGKLLTIWGAVSPGSGIDPEGPYFAKIGGR